MTSTSDQFAHFRRAGYLRVNDAVESDLVDALTECVADACEHRHPDSATREGKQYRMYQRHRSTVTELISHPSLVAVMTGLLGPNVVFVTNRHNQASMNEPGRTDTRLHRDVLQWSRSLLTVVVYLTDATEFNGATHVVPGSHQLEPVGVPQPHGGGTWMNEHPEFAHLADQAVPVPVARGGLLVFDGLLFHAAGHNTSSLARPSIVLGFRSADELDGWPDPATQVLVAGRYIYRGNDAEPDTFRPHSADADHLRRGA